jgi:hypothetical protein
MQPGNTGPHQHFQFQSGVFERQLLAVNTVRHLFRQPFLQNQNRYLFVWVGFLVLLLFLNM